MVCLLPLFLFSGSADCSRTQEGRVLETSREMVEGQSPWLLPHCNGEMRLQKPPLCYWMAGAGFKLGGINEWAGRAPTILATWLAIGLCARVMTSLFGCRAGLFTLVMMLVSYGTFRYGRLAETDAVALLGAVLATWGFWRAADATSPRKVRLWNWAAAIGLTIALTSKGGPTVFPLLFLITWSAINRTWSYLWAFVRSGGLLIFLILGFAWYGYLWETQGLAVVWRELRVVTAGENHLGPFYYYGYTTLAIVAPWAAIVLAGFVQAIRQCKTDRRVLGLLVWLASCLVPLSVIGSKQHHYTLALLPATMLLAGWILDQSQRTDAPQHVRTWLPRLLELTVLVSVFLAAGLPVARVVSKQPIRLQDCALAAFGVVFTLMALTSLHRGRIYQGLLVYSGGLALLFSCLFGAWGASLKGTDVGEVAREVTAACGEGPYLMLDQRVDLPTVFAMRHFAIATRKPREVAAWMDEHPQGTVLVVGEEDPTQAKAPEWLVPDQRFGRGATTIWKMKRIAAP